MSERTYEINRTGRKVVGDFQRVLQTGDIDKLTPGLYYALTMHGGFIAHFSIHGFRDTFRSRLSELLDGEFYPLTDDWAWSESQTRHLESSIYTDGMTAGEVMRDICAVARAGESIVREREADLSRRSHIALAQQIANEYGVTVSSETT